MQPRSPLRARLIGGVMLLLIGFAAGWGSAILLDERRPVGASVVARLLPGLGVSGSTSPQIDEQFGVFWEVWGLVEREFYQRDAIDPTLMTRGAINGMLAALDDPYTFYQEPDLAAQTRQHMQGTFEGIGAYVRIADGKAYIDRPIDDSPAVRAGLLSGDEIVAVDGQAIEPLIAGVDPGEAAASVGELIRGPKGTIVTLTVRRVAGAEPFAVQIARDEVIIPSVKSTLLDDGIAYVKITEFKATTTRELDQALRTLLPLRPRAMVLDLRDNPGGFLTNAQEVLGRFYDGVALHEEHRDGTIETMFTLSGPAETRVDDLPLVVLVNGGSASASEIVAGALRDERPATYLLGEKTFGKGSVQNVHTLRDGGSARITIAQWLTPDREQINAIGITPQYVVPYTEDIADTVPCVAGRRPPEGQRTCADSQLASAIRLLNTGEAPPTLSSR